MSLVLQLPTVAVDRLWLVSLEINGLHGCCAGHCAAGCADALDQEAGYLVRGPSFRLYLAACGVSFEFSGLAVETLTSNDDIVRPSRGVLDLALRRGSGPGLAGAGKRDFSARFCGGSHNSRFDVEHCLISG